MATRNPPGTKNGRYGVRLRQHASPAKKTNLSLSGQLATGVFGVDNRWDRWLSGIALSYTEATGAFSHPSLAGGTLTSSLTSLSPYTHFELNERTRLWGLFGYGIGHLVVTPRQDSRPIETDLSNTLAALGGRTTLSVISRDTGQFELAVRSDARFTETTSDAVVNLRSATGETTRVRALLEGRGEMTLSHATLTPSLEAGLRYDSGDAETGAGLEMGLGIGYSTGRFTMQIKAIGLVAHNDSEYEEWGYTATVGMSPHKDGRGLSLNLGSVRGDAQNGIQSPWNHSGATGYSSAGSKTLNSAQRWRSEIGYGFEGRRGRTLWTPYVGTNNTAGTHWAMRLGVKLAAGSDMEANFELGNDVASGLGQGSTMGYDTYLTDDGKNEHIADRQPNLQIGRTLGQKSDYALRVRCVMRW